MELVAIGTTRFLLGFELAGVEKTVLATPDNIRGKLAEHKDAGIVIVEESLLAKLQQEERDRIETNISPVIITLSATGEEQQERIRKAVKNTLGVDLL